MPGPFHTIDVICARRQALIYVSSPVCEVDFSSSGEPSIVLNPFRRRRGPTGFRFIIVNGRIRFRWDTTVGVICYSLYRREGGVYVLVAECIPCEACDPPDANGCCYECEDCPPGCYVVTAITEDGETETSEEICVPDSLPMCEVTITTPSPLPPANFNAPYSQQLDQEFGLEETEQWFLTAGALPTGLTLSPSGLISGTPTDGGNFMFTAQVFAMCDALSAGENSKEFLLTVQGGPEPTCILRIQNYGTMLEPFFTAGPGGIVSADPEWDGTFNLLNGLDTNGNPSSVPNNYWYQDGSGVFSNPLGVGPAIAVGGKAISRIYLSGPHPADGGHTDPYWILEIIYVQFDGYVVWYGEKTDIPPAPLGTYINPCVFVPSNCPAGGLSDNRPLINLELCP